MKDKKNALTIAIAQINLHVGEITYNTEKVLEAIHKLESATDPVDVLLFPELTLTGYPPEDLLFRDGLYLQIQAALEKIKSQKTDMDIVIGLPKKSGDKIFNSACVIRKGEVIAEYNKWELPNYSVFDEKRYFTSGNEPCVFDRNETQIGLTICEDIWSEAPMKQAVHSGAQIILNLNASPFHLGKTEQRENIVRQRIAENSVPVVYANLVGGQDELCFDGASFVMNASGEVVCRLPVYEESIEKVCFEKAEPHFSETIFPHPDEYDAVYQTLVCGVRDYVQKNGFSGVVLGLSGGIDSALTLMVAVDALGASNVEAVMLPTRYTSGMSLEDAEKLAKYLNVDYRIIAIESVFNSFLELLEPEFDGLPVDATEENIQARIRGIILMGISNKKGKMVLTTGNKSEMAVGYSTLYGDMAGGFDVLKDVPKTLVFEISRYLNKDKEQIPWRIIERPPSAELRDDQTDQDSLPDYEILDAILDLYVEQEKSIDHIVSQGFEPDIVKRVARLVDINEYKRRQAPPGVRITPKAFGKDRRYPLTSGFVDKLNE